MTTGAGPAPQHAAVPGVVRTRAVDLVGPLLHRLPRPDDAVAWVRDGAGLVGWGELARLEVTGPDRFDRAREWWRSLVARLPVEDEVRRRGTGPVAFGSFAFDPMEPSVLVVPRVVLGRADGRSWLTTAGAPPVLSAPEPVLSPGRVRYAQGEVSVTDFRAAVARAVDRIGAGDIEKVVLAHDLLAHADTDIDLRHLLAGLAAEHSDCWTFAVDGLVGATPELLVARDGNRVTSRVLAGTARGDESTELLRSAKDLAEHRYAVDSLVEALEPHVTDLEARGPQLVTLSNVAHLGTDVQATVADGSDVLDLVAALHPTAAVGGTPTDVALRLLPELEPMRRGGYAGPIGWVDAQGDGEWGLALRCAQVTGSTARLFAGCGIVAGSDPDAEVLEAAAKFVPVRDALELDGTP